MTIVRNDPYPGTDYAQHATWKPVKLPSGEIVYEVPGHPERVYVPSLSNASGRVVLRDNPSKAIADDQAEKDRQQDIYDQQQDIYDQQLQNQSPLGQLLPIGAGTAGIIAAQQFMPRTVDPIQQAVAEQIRQRTAEQVLQNGATTAGQQTLSQAAAQGASGAPGVPGVPNILGVDRVEAAAPPTDAGFFSGAQPGTAGQIGGAITAIKGGYDAYNSLQNGGKGIRTGTTEIGGGIGYALGGPLGGGIGAAMGNLAGYGLQGDGIKNNLALAANPITWPLLGARLLGFNPVHKTTRQVAQEHTADLLDVGQEDPGYQNYVQGMRAQYDAAPPDPSKPFHGGQYGSWDEYKKAGLDATDLTGVYGNIKTYGPQWANLTEDQRRAVTQANIDSGLYTSNKGEVEISDAAKAKENFDNVMKGFEVGQKTPVTTPAQAAAQGALTPQTDLLRTVSRSPGIGLDGRRIVY